MFGELRASVPQRQNKMRNQLSKIINEYLYNIGDETVFLRLTPEASALRKKTDTFYFAKTKKRISSYVKGIHNISPLSDTCIKYCLTI